MARLNQRGVNRSNKTRQRWGERLFTNMGAARDFAEAGSLSSVSASVVPEWQRSAVTIQAKDVNDYDSASGQYFRVVLWLVRWPLVRDLVPKSEG